uniref:Uncharacterized protein n=1 Tax=Arundo donax TaxID=35708 RepID=A0A0A8YY70_ARUDO
MKTKYIEVLRVLSTYTLLIDLLVVFIN